MGVSTVLININIMNTLQTETHAGRIFLYPRPYAQLPSRLLLLPLLPHRKLPKPLPSEIWTTIFAYALQHDGNAFTSPLLRVCKAFMVRQFGASFFSTFNISS